MSEAADAWREYVERTVEQKVEKRLDHIEAELLRVATLWEHIATLSEEERGATVIGDPAELRLAAKVLREWREMVVLG